MSFLAEERLWLLAVPALLAAGYLVAQRRRSQYAIRLTTLDLLDQVAPDRPGWRRHLPAALLVLALGVLVVSIARPARSVDVPRDEATLVLAIDVSLSMGAQDVSPNRIVAAQTAARSFLELAPEDIRVGLVAFAEFANSVASPTTDRAIVARSLDSLTLSPATAIGEAIFASLDSIAAARPDDGEVPAAIVLLSDGETTSGRENAEAAAAAVEAGVPVYTVAFGTDEGSVVVDGEVIPVMVDEAALAAIADATGGRFFAAASAGELAEIFDEVGSEIGLEQEDREIGDWFAGLGLLLGALAAVGSLTWFSRLP